MRAGRNPNNYVKSPPPLTGGQAENSKMTPDELRSFPADKEAKLSGDGLERRYLSDPPGSVAEGSGRWAAQSLASMRCRWSTPTARSASFSSSKSAEFAQNEIFFRANA